MNRRIKFEEPDYSLIPDDYKSNTRNFIERLLKKNPKERPYLKEIIGEMDEYSMSFRNPIKLVKD